MKKINVTTSGLYTLLIACIGLLSCNDDNKDYPKEYVGFEHPTQKVECNKNTTESEVQIKIIAIKKSDQDRVVQLSTPPLQPGHTEIVKLTEKQVTIKSGKKSATTIIKIFPKQMVLKQQNVTFTCIPLWKEGEVSKLTIRLQQK